MKSKNVRRWAWLIAFFVFLMLWNVITLLLHVGLSGAAEFPSSRNAQTVSDSPTTMKSSPPIQPLCQREQIREGSWLPVRRKPYYVSRNPHLRCEGVTSLDQEVDTWEWVPNDTSCRFTTWNASVFCALTRFTTISIMGDSLSWEHFSSLLQLLGRRVHQTDQHTSRLKQINAVQAACIETNISATKFVFRNLAHLEADAVRDSITHDFPHLLILNTGAHYQNDTALLAGLRETIVVIQEWQETCRVARIRCHLFWRTTVPGHPNCHSFTAPVNNRTAMQWLVNNPAFYQQQGNLSNRPHSSYEFQSPSWNFHWFDFERQNQLMLTELEQTRPSLELEILDAYPLNVLRPDGHRRNDCLHNCYPGSMDVYSVLLLHHLQQVRSTADSDYLMERYQTAMKKKQAKPSIVS